MTHLLLRLYPRAWRERYGEELRQLVADEGGLSAAVAMNIAWHAMRERGRDARESITGGAGMVIGPAWRHPRMLAVAAFLVLAPTLVFALGSTLAYELGVNALRPSLDVANEWLQTRRIFDLLLVASPAVALVLAVVPLIKLEVRSGSDASEVVVGLRLRLANLVVGGAALAIGGLLAAHIVFESVMQVGS